MLLVVSDVESSLVVHGQSPASDVVEDRFSASCATSTRPTGHSSIPSIADDETVGLSVDEHICRSIQLIRSISFSVATGQHSATGVTPFPFHDAVIPEVSNDHRALLIHMETFRVVELVGGLPLPVSSSDGDPVLCPSGCGCNERDVCVCERSRKEFMLIIS